MDQLSEQQQEQTSEAETSLQLKDRGLARRKFIMQAGIGSLPMVMSLQSGKAWGCIELNCTPGQTSLSNSGSAVASATSDSKSNHYQRPQWSSLKQIQQIFTVDFDGYVLTTYKLALTTRSKGSVVNGVQYYNFTAIDKSNLQSWWNIVKPGSTTTVYTNAPGTTATAGNSKTHNKNNSIMPCHYNWKIIISDSKASIVCPGMAGTFKNVLWGAENADKYALAAIVGSIWERHPEYVKRFKHAKCFPEPNVLIQAYQQAKAAGKLTDLYSLFKLYMSPLPK